ncbi:MAG TPA: hypothetical protein VME22_03255 [Solirubrobacteraceae bacterium]|nr:hypothetical protein [Solirubrobacteraceae bacterium]
MAVSTTGHRLPRALPALVCGVAIAACGSSSTSGSASSNKAASASSAASQGIKFADCMRSHGVANFPDPSGSGGAFKIQIGSGVNPASPSFQSAQKNCGKLLPGGLPGSGPPSAQAHAQLLKTSECMRAHGISDFPDPSSGSPPAPGSGAYSAVMGRGGYFLAIPSSIDMQSPAFTRAAAACGFGGPKQGPG